MKTLILILFPIFGFSQVKFQTPVDFGMTHGGSIASRVGAQVILDDFFMLDGSFRFTSSGGVKYYTESLSGGLSWNLPQVRLMVTGGMYFHQYKALDEKGEPTCNMRRQWPGGSVTVQRGVGIAGIEFNGLYATGFIGIALFNPKAPTICDYH